MSLNLFQTTTVSNNVKGCFILFNGHLLLIKTLLNWKKQTTFVLSTYLQYIV